MEPEEKAKFTVLNSNNPKAKILYQELEFGNYMLFTKESLNENRNENSNEEVPCEENDLKGIWNLKLDGSFSSSGSSAGVV